MTIHYVYILFSEKDKNFYIGFSTDVARRLLEDNSGENESTKTRRPLVLLYYEAHLNKDDALRRENYFKTTKGKLTLKQMVRVSLTLILGEICSSGP